MANIPTEDLSNKNLSRPLIRTMDDDIRMLKANPSLRTAAPLARQNNIPQNLPINPAPVPAPKNQAPVKSKTDEEKEKTDKLKKEIEAAKEELARKEKERVAQIEAEREKEEKKKEEEFRKKQQKEEQEKSEQLRREKEKSEQMETARLEEIRLKKEKERTEQIEIVKKEMEIKKKREEELKKEREKIEQARIEKEKSEQLKKEKEKERKRAEQLEREKKLAEEERIRKEKEMIENAKKEEAARIRKKLADEIKKEMEEDILKEKEKAEQVKIQMELELKKEIEAAEKIKKDRELAMRKRVAKVIKAEMDEEIEKEKEKAEEIKREAEMEIEKEMEEDIIKEKELEEEIKKEMKVDMRKEIADQLKKDKSRLVGGLPEKQEPKIKTNDSIITASQTNPPLRTAMPLVKSDEVIQILNQAQVIQEKEKTSGLEREKELEIIKQKDGEIRKEREKAEQIRKEKEKLEQVIKEKSLAEEKSRLIGDLPKKQESEVIKQNTPVKELRPKNDDVFSYKSAWQDSPLKNSFFTDAIQEVPASTPIRKTSPSSSPDAKQVSASVPKPPQNTDEPNPQPPANLPKKIIFSKPKAPEPALRNAIERPIDFYAKKKLSPFSDISQPGHKAEPNSAPKKSAKNQYLEASGDYEYLSPEMRLSRQGFSSLGADLEEGVRKDTELMDKNLALKKKLAASGTMPVSNPPKEVSIKEALLKQDAVRAPSSVFKKILKVVISLLFMAGVIYGIYYFIFKTSSLPLNPLTSISPASQPILPGLKKIEISADFNYGVIPAIREYVNNNAANAQGVFQAAIKDTSGKNTLKISDFEKALGVVIPVNFSNNLTGDYSLVVFNYPQNNYLRMGLILKVKNSDSAEVLANDWESLMFVDTNPLLLDASGYYDAKKSFGISSYKNISIKYLSLGKDNLALNYSIDKNKNLFIFATSQGDIHQLIDEIQK